jgi:hypothetical protein
MGMVHIFVHILNLLALVLVIFLAYPPVVALVEAAEAQVVAAEAQVVAAAEAQVVAVPVDHQVVV